MLPSGRPTRRKLLLADDSVNIQRVIELTFADEDIDVIAVGDGDAAVARLESEPPDIVLADVGMPGRDGYEVAQYVRRSSSLSHIPVVLLTGALQPVDEAKAREAGCAGVLVKPFEPHMVIAKVRELLERRTGVPAARAVPDEGAAAASGGAEDASSPADAVLNSPLSPHAAPQSSDDYFAELDAAFASIDTQGPPAAAPSHPPSPAAHAPAPGRHTMADAFAALLALEQGRAPARGPDDWPDALAGLVDEIAHRVAEQVADRVVRDLAPGIVSRIAERIVREEIERLRQETESPNP